MLRGVAFARDHHIFQVFPLLIFNFELTSIGRDHVDFQFTVSAIELGIRGMVGTAVLIAYVTADLMENLRKLGLKSRKVGAATSQAREGVHLVVGLQIIHLTNRDARSVRR